MGKRAELRPRVQTTIATDPFTPQTSEGEVGFQLLFHLNPLPMWVIDAESQAFLAVNEAAIKKYGWSREEFLTITMPELG